MRVYIPKSQRAIIRALALALVVIMTGLVYLGK